MKQHRFTKEEILKAINNSKGIISIVARRLGCQWATAQKYIEKWKETKIAYENEIEKTIDIAEHTVIKSIQTGNVGTAKWFLTKKGYKRGYGEDSPEAVEDGLQKDEILKIIIDKGDVK